MVRRIYRNRRKIERGHHQAEKRAQKIEPFKKKRARPKNQPIPRLLRRMYADREPAQRKASRGGVMRTKLVHFKEDNIDILSNLHGGFCESQNRIGIERLKRILSKSLTGELTDTQRYCITEYYINRKKQKEIAKDLGVATSTVCRHINRGLVKLKKIASYYS